jgi:hypothetical protein
MLLLLKVARVSWREVRKRQRQLVVEPYKRLVQRIQVMHKSNTQKERQRHKYCMDSQLKASIQFICFLAP